MRTELFHLSTNPQNILPKGGRILTIMSANTGSTPAEIEIIVEPGSGPNSTLTKRTIQPNTTLSIPANKDDKIRLEENQNISAQCNSGSADIMVAWLGANTDPSGEGSSSSSNSSSSSSTKCTRGSTCPPPGGTGGCGPECQCFELITLNCTQQGSGPCECTQAQSTWVKCSDCPNPDGIPATCESTIEYCTGNSIPCCDGQCQSAGPNSDGEMCPESEKCCGGKCCPKKQDGSVECCPDGTCLDENTLGACYKEEPDPNNVDEVILLCTMTTEADCIPGVGTNFVQCETCASSSSG